ncbi:hypothetical protein GGX14DRAFT_553860 [Mycena pura]|uniref:Uncharacterized protein n=1 Tax=Mycena pura TaxID=153505 RepID=A0AAD7E6N8_9AGAR|nr:hypothetical protein GGX14DRAFT_553860 [Mycena pura]
MRSAILAIISLVVLSSALPTSGNRDKINADMDMRSTIDAGMDMRRGKISADMDMRSTIDADMDMRRETIDADMDMRRDEHPDHVDLRAEWVNYDW